MFLVDANCAIDQEQQYRNLIYEALGKFYQQLSTYHWQMCILAEPRRCSLDETRSREELCNKAFTKSTIGSIINFRRRVTP